MFYVKEIITPANTSRLAPKITEMKVWGGVIHHVEIMFPPGCMSLLHVTLSIGGWQFAPSDPDQSFAGDDETISYREYIPLKSGWNVIKIKTWNEDDTYDHMCRVRIGILPKWLVDPRREIRVLAGRMGKLLRRIGAV